MNVPKAARALNQIGKSLCTLSDAIIEGETWEIDQDNLLDFAAQVARAVSPYADDEEETDEPPPEL